MVLTFCYCVRGDDVGVVSMKGAGSKKSCTLRVSKHHPTGNSVAATELDWEKP
jgi:hypothetical protein